MRFRWAYLLAVAALAASLAAARASHGATGAAAPPCPPAWTTIHHPPKGPPQSVGAVSAGQVWTVGKRGHSGLLMSHWSHGRWQAAVAPHPPGSHGQLVAVSAGRDAAWAVGDWWRPGRPQHALVTEAVDGGMRSSAGPSLPGHEVWSELSVVQALSSRDVLINGRYHPADHPPHHPIRSLVARFDGQRWQLLPVAPHPAGAMSATSDADVWLAGTKETRTSTDVTFSPIIEHWNGRSWTQLAAPDLGSSVTFLDAVHAFSTHDVWFGGHTEDRFGSHMFVLHWDGTSLQVVPTPGDQPLEPVAIGGSGPRDMWLLANGLHMVAQHWDGARFTIAPNFQPQLGRPTSIDEWKSLSAARGAAFRVGRSLQRICPARVTDSGLAAGAGSIPLGSMVVWHASSRNSSAHTLTDASGLNLFHPQHAAPGSGADAVLPASGSYRVRDETTGDVMTVPERMLIRASGAVAGTPFTAYWATPRASSALLYDVEVRAPGSLAWTPWLTATPDRFADYTPAAAGRYAFRARARNADGTLALGWSPAAGVVVSAG